MSKHVVRTLAFSLDISWKFEIDAFTVKRKGFYMFRVDAFLFEEISSYWKFSKWKIVSLNFRRCKFLDFLILDISDLPDLHIFKFPNFQNCWYSKFYYFRIFAILNVISSNPENINFRHKCQIRRVLNLFLFSRHWKNSSSGKPSFVLIFHRLYVSRTFNFPS